MQMIYPEFFEQLDTHIKPPKEAIMASTKQRKEIFKICDSRYSKNALTGCLFLNSFVKHFPNY